eukprot:GHVN01103110.1.p2 GENE.GHVN01103110.1~~GHVN01103110.1.p2  ORF type:complete len:120 (+),score=32.83 GHVN01103110.1:233-592(+)
MAREARREKDRGGEVHEVAIDKGSEGKGSEMNGLSDETGVSEVVGSQRAAPPPNHNKSARTQEATQGKDDSHSNTEAVTGARKTRVQTQSCRKWNYKNSQEYQARGERRGGEDAVGILE